MPADPTLAMQKAIRELLIESDDLLELVPADNVLDVTGRPERSPLIQIGEGQTVFSRFYVTANMTLHVWTQEPGLTQSKMIAGAIVDALNHDPQDGVLHFDGFTCHELSIEQTRFMRDPKGNFSHGIVSVSAIMQAT